MTFDPIYNSAPQALGLVHEVRVSTDKNAPVAILVHGRAGNINVMSLFEQSIPLNWSILRVQAPVVDPIGGYSWWLIDDPNKAEVRNQSAKLLESFIVKSLEFYQITTNTIVGLGFSQGGAVLSKLVQTPNNKIVGLALIASFVIPVSEEELIPINTKILIAHGSKDEIVPIEKVVSGKKYLEDLGAEVELHIDDCGHKIGVAGMRGLKLWLKNFN